MMTQEPPESAVPPARIELALTVQKTDASNAGSVRYEVVEVNPDRPRSSQSPQSPLSGTACAVVCDRVQRAAILRRYSNFLLFPPRAAALLRGGRRS